MVPNVRVPHREVSDGACRTSAPVAATAVSAVPLGPPPGESVFVDANTLVYHFVPDPVYGTACSALLIRIKRQELGGYTSTHGLSEVAHRLMTIEAIRLYSWPVPGIAQRLRKHPQEVQKLTAFRQALQEIAQFGIQVYTIPPLLSIRPRPSVSRPACSATMP